MNQEGGITSLQAYQVLRNCGTELVYEKPEDRVKLAHGFWDQLMEIGVKPDVMLHNALLSVYIQNNHTFDPLEVLEKMENSNIDPNRTTLLLLIQGYAQKGDIAGAFKVLEFIKEAGMPLTEQVFSALITAYGFNGDPESARGVFDLMRENGLEPELDSYTALLGIYGESGDMEAIMTTLSEMQDKRVHPNKKVFLTLLNSLSKRGHHGLIRELLQTSIVKSLLDGEGGITSLQAYQVLRNCGTELVYEKPEDRVKLAHGFWDQLMEIGVKPDVMLHNALLSVYIQNNHTFDPLEVLEKMENSNIDPNRTTLLLLIQGYAQKGDIAGAFKVLEFIKEAGMPLTEQVFSALITAYGFNGDPESARGVFDLMRENGLEPELDSYTALLGIYGEAGDMEAIMSTLSEMQDKRVHPNKKVFLTLLNSLSKRGHHGLIRELLQTSIVKSLLDGDLKDLMLAVATRGEISSAFIFLNHMIEMGSNRRTPLRAEFALLRQVILSGQVG
ncbi:PREDICTED: leucine-rich PPR motif-containing protein, mitochondrial-like [Acropora digitifera]|uniref:leucine-rich PPR motif-containing protein, mitochondrial-like n=1 Tax=Acropora digitifera TaxID=70779 RepID=UPI00077A87F3|nr:PREDICTED: leucine-rich PPR motif-containing protein, mitochondrial-like [Acropora digitifera]